MLLKRNEFLEGFDIYVERYIQVSESYAVRHKLRFHPPLPKTKPILPTKETGRSIVLGIKVFVEHC